MRLGPALFVAFLRATSAAALLALGEESLLPVTVLTLCSNATTYGSIIIKPKIETTPGSLRLLAPGLEPKSTLGFRTAARLMTRWTSVPPLLA